MISGFAELASNSFRRVGQGGTTKRSSGALRLYGGRKFDEPIALPNGRDAPMTKAVLPMLFELRRPLAAGRRQKRIDGLG
jgi:hypothetical protein